MLLLLPLLLLWSTYCQGAGRRTASSASAPASRRARRRTAPSTSAPASGRGVRRFAAPPASAAPAPPVRRRTVRRTAAPAAPAPSSSPAAASPRGTWRGRRGGGVRRRIAAAFGAILRGPQGGHQRGRHSLCVLRLYPVNARWPAHAGNWRLHTFTRSTAPPSLQPQLPVDSVRSGSDAPGRWMLPRRETTISGTWDVDVGHH